LQYRIQRAVLARGARAASVTPFLPWNLHAGLACQLFHGLGKVQSLEIHQEADGIAAGAAAETVIELLVRADAERGGLLVVEGAEGRIVLAGLLQLDPRADHLDHIGASKKIVNETLRDQPGHACCLANVEEQGRDDSMPNKHGNPAASRSTGRPDVLLAISRWVRASVSGERLGGPGIRPGRTLRLNSVQALAAAIFALQLLGVTLDGSSCLALALGSGLFVELATTDFSQNAGFFAGALETTQGDVEGFVLFYFDGRHFVPFSKTVVNSSDEDRSNRISRGADVTAFAGKMQRAFGVETKGPDVG